MTTPPFVAGNVLTAAQMNLGAWQVATATAAGTATTLTVNDCFTSDFDYYRIYIFGSSATAGNLTLQLTSSGTAAATTYYYNQVLRSYNSTTNTVTNASNTTSMKIGELNTGALGASSNIVLDVLNPAEARVTMFNSMNSKNTTDAFSIVGTHYAATAYDGFKLTSGSATNLTLDVSIYGLIGA